MQVDSAFNSRFPQVSERRSCQQCADRTGRLLLQGLTILLSAVGHLSPILSKRKPSIAFKSNLQGALASYDAIGTCSGAIFNRSTTNKEDKSRTQIAERKATQQGAMAINKGNLHKPAFALKRPRGGQPLRAGQRGN